MFKALRAKWKELGLHKAPFKILHLLMDLPLALVHFFEDGFKIVKNIAREFQKPYYQLETFLRYFKRLWHSKKIRSLCFWMSVTNKQFSRSISFSTDK